MFAAFTFPARRSVRTASAVAAVTALVLLAAGGQTLPSAEAQPPTSSVPMALKRHVADTPNAAQPPAKIIVDLPKPELLAEGVAIVQFRTENVQIVPVFGPDAAKVSPRLGHLRVTLDDAPWHWAHTSNDPVLSPLTARAAHDPPRAGGRRPQGPR
jgi:hypothetical protein